MNVTTLIGDMFMDARNDTLSEDKPEIYKIFPLKCYCSLRKPDIL